MLAPLELWNDLFGKCADELFLVAPNIMNMDFIKADIDEALDLRTVLFKIA
jgi:hypothetical protein